MAYSFLGFLPTRLIHNNYWINVNEMLLKFGDFPLHSAYFLVIKLLQYYTILNAKAMKAIKGSCDFTFFGKKVHYWSEKTRTDKNLGWLTLCRCTSRALEAFNLASFLDFPEPSNDMSFNEALIINCGAWDGPDVDISSETKQRGQTKRFLFSESIDAFVISSNIWTFFSELKNLYESA